LRVYLRLIQPLDNITGVNKLEVNIAEEITVEELIEKMAKSLGERFKRAVVDPKTGELQVTALVDGKRGGLKTKLRDGATVVFVMPFAGG
jgi:molybdopterin converting factor small subunit